MLEKDKREAPVKLIFRILIIVLIFDFIYFCATIGEEFFINDGALKLGNSITYGTIFDLFLILLQVGIVSLVFIRWYFSYYRIGQTYITKKTGIFFKKNTMINYHNIRIITYQQGFLGKIFDYGDLVFELAAGENTKFIIRNIESPQLITNDIENFKKSED